MLSGLSATAKGHGRPGCPDRLSCRRRQVGMPGLDLLRQAVHNPAFLTRRPEILGVEAHLPLTAAGQCYAQDYVPPAARFAKPAHASRRTARHPPNTSVGPGRHKVT